ncbi:unnamed protein product (macronuclear) [Paramecium tetraurelia]|uniref:Transmembrane protein n=1 Tax=Paramecium tetraurelia TaxID=5888 RepID=A0DF80_PARTE|nr:uncharacterized protein GSPATT00016510001 [Paramecium tetraurelia]CAK81697.1 unnamed protein product [Paramecium tetraurelia]|eukprot:XP_001449094.1 hypothetical protein (macronuclear) [Paramecium tetraurelia strain d4-2]
MVLRYHWSLAINKLQKLIIKRCQQPLLNIQEERRKMKKSRSQQPSLLSTNKRFEHLRYHSQQAQNLSESKKEEEISTRMQDKFESAQKDNNINEKILKPQIGASENRQKKQHNFVHRVAQINQSLMKNFQICLRNKRKLAISVVYVIFQKYSLAQYKVKEQEILIKKIQDSRPCKPIPNVKTFLSLIKKPLVEQSKPIQQQEFEYFYQV